MSEKKFVDGLFTSRRENAPEFVIANLSINTEKFIAWLIENTSAKGFCNIDLKVGKSGKMYAELNEWKPQGEQEIPGQPEQEELNVGNIPF